MAIIHFAQREVEAKVVYWGPALSGKTTNLRFLFLHTADDQKGELHTLNTSEERTLFFDYLPLKMGNIAGFNARFKVFSVPGQLFYRETRRMVLRGADAVVFVADSAEDRLSHNIESLKDLEDALVEMGRSLDEISFVFQYNKRDLPDALTRQVMDVALNSRGAHVVEAVATDGRGVAETLDHVTGLVSRRIGQDLAQGTRRPGLQVSEDAVIPDAAEVQENLKAISRVRPGEDRQLKAHLARSNRDSDAQHFASRFAAVSRQAEPESVDDAPSDRIIYLPPMRAVRPGGRQPAQSAGPDDETGLPWDEAPTERQSVKVPPTSSAAHVALRQPARSSAEPPMAPARGVSPYSPPVSSPRPSEGQPPRPSAYADTPPLASTPSQQDRAPQDRVQKERTYLEPRPTRPSPASFQMAGSSASSGGPALAKAETAPEAMVFGEDEPTPAPIERSRFQVDLTRPRAEAPQVQESGRSVAPSRVMPAKAPPPVKAPPPDKASPPTAQRITVARRVDPTSLGPEARDDGWKEPHIELPIGFLGRGFNGHRTTRLHGARLAPDGSVEVRLTLSSRLNGEDRSVMVRLLGQVGEVTGSSWPVARVVAFCVLSGLLGAAVGGLAVWWLAR